MFKVKKNAHKIVLDEVVVPHENLIQGTLDKTADHHLRFKFYLSPSTKKTKTFKNKAAWHSYLLSQQEVTVWHINDKKDNKKYYLYYAWGSLNQYNTAKELCTDIQSGIADGIWHLRNLSQPQLSFYLEYRQGWILNRFKLLPTVEVARERISYKALQHAQYKQLFSPAAAFSQILSIMPILRNHDFSFDRVQTSANSYEDASSVIPSSNSLSCLSEAVITIGINQIARRHRTNNLLPLLLTSLATIPSAKALINNQINNEDILTKAKLYIENLWFDLTHTLHKAIEDNDLITLHTLLSHGNHDPNAMNMQRVKALSIALKNNNIAAARLLVEYGATLEFETMYWFFDAIKAGNEELVRFLLAYKATSLQRINFRDALNLALQNKQTTIARLLVENGADPNYSYVAHNTWLCQAVSDGDEELVRFLLEHKADPNFASSKYPLKVTSEKRHFAIARLLIENGANPNSFYVEDKAWLYQAASDGDEELVKFLLEHKADPNFNPGSYSLNFKNYPLRITLEKKHFTIARLLVENGANPNIDFASDSENRWYSRQNWLCLAIDRGDLTLVEFLLKYKADPNYTTYTSPLLAAVQEKNIAIIKLLLIHGADPNVEQYGEDLLQFVIDSSNEELLQIMLDHGLSLNKRRSYHPLVYALEKKHLGILKLISDHWPDLKIGEQIYLLYSTIEAGNEAAAELLLQSRFNPYKNTENKAQDHKSHLTSNFITYKSPLELALINRNKNLVELLLRYGADPNDKISEYRSTNHLTIAINNGDTACVKILLKYGAVIKPKLDNPIILAFEKNELDIVKLLIEHDKGINKIIGDEPLLYLLIRLGKKSLIELYLPGTTPLAEIIKLINVAIYYDQLEIIEYLVNSFSLEKGSLAEITDSNLHMICTRRNNVELLKLLLSYGGNFDIKNDEGQSLLHTAVIYRNTPILKLLLDYPIDVNTRDKYGQTALYSAADAGEEEAVKLLIENNADVNICSDAAHSPIALAIINRRESIFDLLLMKNVKLNTADKEGQTPLHLAIIQGSAAMVLKLLEAKAIVHLKNKNDLLPLELAIKNGSKIIIQLLLEYGADINAADEYGRSPLFKAIDQQDEKQAELLLEFHADSDKPDIVGRTPLQIAIDRSNISLIKILLKYNAKIDPSFIQRAAIKGDEDIASYLAQNIIEKNKKTEFSDTHFNKISEPYSKNINTDKNSDSILELISEKSYFSYFTHTLFGFSGKPTERKIIKDNDKLTYPQKNNHP